VAGYDSNIVTGHSHVWRKQHGVTLVELIAVMIIIGVLGAVATSRYFDRAGFDAGAFAAQARSMLRYAQKTAVAQNRNVYVRLDGNSVALCFDAACNAPDRITAPSGANSGSAVTRQRCDNSATWFCEAAPGGISYTLTGTGSLFRFDALGKPFKNGDPDTSAASSFERTVLTIVGDGSTRTITVEPETGYVF
jgi:MSHA pilin protein MshC